MKTFGAIWRKSGKKHQENHWVFHSNLTTFRNLAQVNFSLGKTAFRKMKKWSCENLINLGVYWWFWEHFCGMVPKSYGKALCLSVNLVANSRLPESLNSLGKTATFRQRPSWSKNPYKTCGMPRLFGAFPQNAIQNLSKTITFITIPGQEFAESQNLCFPVENGWFWSAIFVICGGWWRPQAGHASKVVSTLPPSENGRGVFFESDF